MLWVLGSAAQTGRTTYNPNTDTTPPKTIMDTGASPLRNAAGMKEVVVKGRKPPVGFRMDRQVFRAAEYAGALNGNAVDLVRNLPSVSLDGQGILQLRGTTSFLVLVNGRPTQGDPSFILSQIPAAQVESVELISTPGASFDADGRGGILNIITRTAPEKGWLVQSSLMLGAPSLHGFGNTRYTNPRRGSADMLLSWRNHAWEFGAGFNGQRNDMSGYRIGDVETRTSGRTTHFPSEGERSYRRHNQGARLSLAWEPDNRNRFEAAFYAGARYQSRVADLDYDNRYKDGATGTESRFRYFNENTQQKEGVFTLASLGSSHKLGKHGTLLFSAQYEGADLSGRTTNRNLAQMGSATDYQTTENPSRNPLEAYRAKVDFIERRNGRTWQAGYQFRYDDQRGDFSNDYRNLGQTAFTRDPAFSGSLRVSNHIHAAYAQTSGEKGDLSWQAGLRAEHLHRSLESSISAKEELTMPNLFPSVMLRQRLGKSSTLKYAYTRRVKRTNNFELNPIPEREHSETLEQGDPRLLPERTGTWEAGWERKLRQGSLALTAYHQRILDPIQRVNGVFNDSILSRVFTNAERALQSGIEGSLDLRPGKVWQVLLGANVYRYDIRGAVLGKGLRSNGSWVMSLNATQTLSLKHAWSLQFTLNWLTRRATVQGTDGPFINPGLTVRKVTGDGRWSFLAQWLYMDAGLGISNRQRISTSGADFRTTTLYIYEPDQLQVSASFNLKRKNRNPSLPQSEMAEKEF